MNPRVTGRRPTSAAVLACLVVLLAATTATYVPWTSRKSVPSLTSAINAKANYADDSRGDKSERRQRAFFKDDAEIYRFLKGYGRQLMLWRCRNAIQPHWTAQRPPSFVDLFCDVIGTVETVTWSHKGAAIAGTSGSSEGSRYRYSIGTHHEEGRYYAAWHDFHLRIFNATDVDSGVYRFRVTGPAGDSDEQVVYVDLSNVAASGSTAHVNRRWPNTSSSSAAAVATAAKAPEEKYVKRRMKKPGKGGGYSTSAGSSRRHRQLID